jgi:hypothetical protein
MTYKPKKSSKRATTTRSSKKKVVLVRPDLDFTKPLEEQKEALEEFVDSFAEELMKPGLSKGGPAAGSTLFAGK